MEKEPENTSELYLPVDPKYYNYKGKNKLSRDAPQTLDMFENILICPYTVNNTGKYPFLRFLLMNTLFDKELSLPQVYLMNNLIETTIVEYVTKYLFGLLILSDFDKFNETIEFNGFFEYKQNLYLFFDITKCNIEINDIYKSSHLWLALVDEIVNHKQLCNIKISDNTTEFFTLNEEFIFLLDEKEESYEIPIVSYVGKKENKVNFTYVFGETARDRNSILGPFYYFHDYYTAVKFATLNNSKSGDHERNYDVLMDFDQSDTCKGGIVRFAVFTGVTKYFENNVGDVNDLSEIKTFRLQYDNLDQNIERLTLRICDHDGNWSKDHDSAYLGYVELDNGTFIKNPILVLKEYNQQVPLSYHYIDRKSVKSDIHEYSIM